MTARAGEQAWETGTFVCQICNEEVKVQEGRMIPQCPNGHTTFDQRVEETTSRRPNSQPRARKAAPSGRAATARTTTRKAARGKKGKKGR